MEYNNDAPGTIRIPAWLGTKLIPLALVSMLGFSFNVWLDVYNLKADLNRTKEELREFKSAGGRCTAAQCAAAEARISSNSLHIDQLQDRTSRAEVQIEQLIFESRKNK